jgi:hypothetical protein
VRALTDIAKLKGSPIQRRQARIEAFKRFVSSNRKQKSIRELIALYALESGLRKKVVEEYLQLLLDSGFCKKQHVGRRRFVLFTEAECTHFSQEP